MTDSLIRIMTAFSVMAVMVMAGDVSYQHVFKLAHSHAESMVAAQLLPFTVGGMIWVVPPI
jgi:hypothetical protein